MRAPRSLGAEVALALVGAVTSTVVLLSWRGFTAAPDDWLGTVLVGAALVGVAGALLRRVGVPTLPAFLLQAVGAVAFVLLALTGSALPRGATWDRLGADLAGALETIPNYAAPVPADAASIVPVLLPSGMAIALLVDLLALSARRASLAGLALLTAYTVPVSLLLQPVEWWVFALTALGFLAMLHLQESAHLARWGRRLPATDGASGPAPASRAFRSTAAGVAVAATALAVAVPATLPTLELALFDGGRGGGGDVRVENPMVDLRRDLTRGEDVPLVEVTTDDPDPQYLRIGVLTRFSDDEWTPGDRTIPSDQDGTSTLPPLEGVDARLRRTVHSYELRATDEFRSTWLPVPEHLLEVSAAGPWRWDAETRDLTSTRGDDFTTAGLDWTARAAEIEYDPEAMDRALSSVGTVSSDYTDLPDDLPQEVRALAREVTAEGGSKFEKAVLLQQWFREAGGFEYDDQVVSGNGTDDLVRFLTEGPEGRRGYCEQFSASMAVMARALNIPARVAIGFLRPSPVGPRTFVYSAHDMHAWTEVFIPGSGWVLFEPTPQRRAPGVPPYTRFGFVEPEAPAAPSSTAPGDGRSSAAADPAGRQPDRGEGAAGGGDGAGAVAWAWVAAVAGVLAVLALLLLAPRALRRRRRAARERTGDPEAAWAELRDVAVDLRLPWPEGTTPRATGILMAEHFGDGSTGDPAEERPRRAAALAPEAVEALGRLCLAVERHRWAPPGAAARADLWPDVLACTAAWRAGASERVRRRADWWPASVFRRAARPVAGAATVPGREGAVDRVSG